MRLHLVTTSDHIKKRSYHSSHLIWHHLDWPQLARPTKLPGALYDLLLKFLSSFLTNTHRPISRDPLDRFHDFYRPRSRGDNTFGSVRPSVCLWALSCLNHLTLDIDFWHKRRPWPWLAWGFRSRSYVKGQGQTVKIVYALPFESVVRSRSTLRLCLPSSANGNCEWPLPVHWNCLFVSNQRAFNVSGRSAIIHQMVDILLNRLQIWRSSLSTS